MTTIGIGSGHIRFGETYMFSIVGGQTAEFRVRSGLVGKAEYHFNLKNGKTIKLFDAYGSEFELTLETIASRHKIGYVNQISND